MKTNENIAVFVNNNVDDAKKVISYVRNGIGIYNVFAECISLEDGCHSPKSYYKQLGYKVISFEEFERVYLKKDTIVSSYEVY